MKRKYKKIHTKQKRDLLKRLKHTGHVSEQPMFDSSNIHYEISDRVNVLRNGGIGAIHLLAKNSGLVNAIDQNIELLKFHKPYHESDHILNIAYNILCGGENLEDLELLRNDSNYLNGLDTDRIPDPTTAGDFLRRFETTDVMRLQETINTVRVPLWRQCNREFRRKAIIQIDAKIVDTDSNCKAGVDMAYNGKIGYSPLVVSLENTREVLYIENRGANIVSQHNAAYYLDKSVDLVKPHFKSVCLRGDSAYSLTENFDRWDDNAVEFMFSYDAQANLVAKAKAIDDWQPLKRQPKYEVETASRQKPENHRQKVIDARGCKNIRLTAEHVAEFEYQPTKCKKSYRVIVVKKDLNVEKYQTTLFRDVRYYFYITNRTDLTTSEAVYFANERSDHENDIEQLTHGVKAFCLPSNTTESNWAYMVIAALAWSFKAWMGLMLVANNNHGAGKRMLRMEFKRFLNEYVSIPAQIVKTGRKIVFRFVSYMAEAPTFFQLFDLIKNYACF